MTQQAPNPNDVLAKAESLRGGLSSGFRDEIVKSLYSEAESIARRAVRTVKNKKYDLDQRIDRLVTSPITGLPIMVVLLALVIWLTVPLALIGVTAGLLLTRQPFGFMAMLGFLSLSGMLIKNAIVLIDEIELQRKTMPVYDAIVVSGVSRLRPVAMAALTTALGLIPLLVDAFFVAMAVTIIFGLMIATVLTMVFVPVLYATFFGVAEPPRE